MSGRLVLVGTPLGNRGDLSPRARQAILEADLLLCEDTRSPSRLLPGESLPPRRSCFVGNESERVATLVEHLEEDKTVVFMSEAGMPVWSDPGRVLVAAAVQAGAAVDVVPGPTAAATAVCHTGFDASAVLFVGFLPRGGTERRAALQRIAAEPAAVVLYESGGRTPDTLRDLAAVCTDAATRRVAVARELTKLHQEVLRGTLSEVAGGQSGALRGEVTVVLEGTRAPAQGEDERAPARAVLDAMLDGRLKPRERARRIADATGLEAREVYRRLSGRGSSGDEPPGSD